MIFTMFLLLCKILITAFLIAVVWWYTELFKYYKYLKKYKGPLPLPLVGNAHLLASTTKFIPTALGFQKQYGGVIKLFIGYRPRLLIADYKLAEFILASNVLLEKSYDYEFLHSWLGTGLLTSSSVKWKRQRKLITPAFHFQILEQFIDVFESQGKILIHKLKKEPEEKPFNIYSYVTLCTLDIICEAAMGTQVNAQNASNSEYVRSVEEMCRIILERSFSPLKMWNFTFKFTKDYNIEKNTLEVLHGYTNSIIARRREELVNNLGKARKDDDTGIKKRLAFLDLLLQCNIDGEPLPDDVIREEVDTFMFEGHDTTASGISFTLYCLANNPDVQQKAVEELRCIFEDDENRSPTYKDFQEMKYLEMVIKESMRIYPPVPIYGRTLMEDVEYEGQILPKGVTLTMFTFGLHRQSEIFPEPEKFDPERFSPENSTGRSPYAYLPFSAGPRNCIGQRFAILEMKSTVSKVLKNFELLPVPGHTPILVSEAILKSANGLLVSLRKRNF